ncbi:hypothetical protein, partial [Bordetella bronchiseptica]|uniref:hypothetical protein n=1 Tax=Bordetella bronchiseptica TaxID=518 RepID=UPI001F31B4BB
AAVTTMKAIALSTFENEVEGLVRRGTVLQDLDSRRFKALQLAGLVDEEGPGRKKLEAGQVLPKRAPAHANKRAPDPQNKGRGGRNGGASNA